MIRDSVRVSGRVGTVSRRRRVVGYLPFDGDGSASTGAPAWPRSPSASVAIDWDVAVTLARPSFQPLYAALYCGAGGDGVHMGWLLISA